MTARFECETVIAAPVPQVFDLALDIDAHLASMSGNRERAVGGVTRGRIGLGQDVTWRARHFGAVWTMTSRVVELDRPRRFVDEQVSGPFARFRHEHLFVPIGDGTRMTDVVSFTAPLGLLGRIAETALGPYLRRLIVRRGSYLAGAATRR